MVETMAADGRHGARVVVKSLHLISSFQEEKEKA